MNWQVKYLKGFCGEVDGVARRRRQESRPRSGSRRNSSTAAPLSRNGRLPHRSVDILVIVLIMPLDSLLAESRWISYVFSSNYYLLFLFFFCCRETIQWAERTFGREVRLHSAARRNLITTWLTCGGSGCRPKQKLLSRKVGKDSLITMLYE